MGYPRAIAPEASEERDASTRATWIAVAIAVVLLVLRVERALLAGADLGAAQWLRWLTPELGLAAMLGAAFALLPPGPVRRRLVTGVSALVLILGVIAAQYFAHTGTPLNRTLVGYTLSNLGGLGGLLATGLDPGLLLRALLALGAWGLAIRLDARRPARWPSSPGHALALLVVGAVAYGTTLPAGPPYPGRHALALEPLTGGASAAAPLDPDDPDSLYVAPELGAAGPGPHPNVVVILLESTRRDVVVPYGPPEAASVTPFLASVADRAVVVDQAHVTTSHTSKALVGILCGMYPRPRMEITEPFHLPARCLPELLASAGYRTAYFQSALGAFEDRRELVTRMGFDHVAAQEDLATGSFAPVGYVAMDERVMLEPILSWTAASEGPFLVTALTSVPHHPYEVPGPVPPEAAEGSEIAYAAAIHHVDAFVGQLFEGLEEQGVLEDTLVVVLADHGEAFGEHQRRQHDAVPNDEVTTVPWLMFGERFVGRPRHIGGLRSHLDLVPTILEAAGLSWTGTLPGRSLLSSSGHPVVYTSCWFDEYCAAARQGDTKIIFHHGRQPMERFDLGDDPNETSPLPVDEAVAARWEQRFATLHATIEAIYTRDAPADLPDRPPPAPLARPQCMRACVADTDPTTPGLQYQCTVSEVAPDGTRTSLPHCADGSIPGDATACFVGAVDQKLPPYCARRGFNLELKLRRAAAAGPGAVIDAACQLSASPEVECAPERLLGGEAPVGE